MPGGSQDSAIERDLRHILWVQAIRAALYGFGTVVLGTALADSGLSDTQVGLVFTAMLAGMALATVAVGALGDRIGRRRLYTVLLVALGVVGAAFALYPVVLPARKAEYSLTIANTSAGAHGLSVGFYWWSIGMVLAIGYFVFVYRMFRGKVRLDGEGY